MEKNTPIDDRQSTMDNPQPTADRTIRKIVFETVRRVLPTSARH